MGNIRLIGLIILLLAAPQVLGLDVEIVPESPTSSDVVTITLSGWWGGCAPNVSNISVEGNNIYFDALLDYPPDTLCIYAIWQWELSEDVGPLSPGTYSVYGSCCGIFPSGDYEWLTDFVVTDEPKFVPLAYPTIQSAIDDCNDGDTVIVSPGIYTGVGNRDLDFLGKAITVRGTDPNDPCVVAATIIDCNGSDANNHRGFNFINDEGPDSVLEGLTITDGYTEQWSGGGGIYIHNASPTISRCAIINNHAELEPELPGLCYGGGIKICGDSNPLIINCNISGNSAGPLGNGGGISCGYDCGATIQNCLIANNTASSYGFGGGISCDGNNVTVTNCTITGNSASTEGGGIYLSLVSFTMTNSIVWDNSPNQIDIYGSGNITIMFSDIQDGWPDIGNIDADPCFADADANDFHLKPGSPCIDTGDPTYVAGPEETDIDGQLRVINGRVDMGVDEFNHFGTAGDITGDGKVDFYDLAILVDQWLQPPGVPSADIAPAPPGDNFVDFLDFAILAENWLKSITE